MGYTSVPASADTVCRYIAYLDSTGHKSTTIPQYLNIISVMHKQAGLQNPIQGNWKVQSLLTGIKRLKGESVQQKLPVDQHMLYKIRTCLKPYCSLDMTFWAACLVAFFSFLRMGNLLLPSASSFNPTVHLTLKDITFHKWGTILKLRWSKTIQFSERILCIPLPKIQNSPLCPTAALKRAIALSMTTGHNGPAFSYLVYCTDTIKPLTYKDFLAKFKDCLSKVGYHTTRPLNNV